MKLSKKSKDAGIPLKSHLQAGDCWSDCKKTEQARTNPHICQYICGHLRT